MSSGSLSKSNSTSSPTAAFGVLLVDTSPDVMRAR
jgi:hypothetical protein